MDNPPQTPPPASAPISASELERLVLEARASGDYEPLLARFVNTLFYVGIATTDEGPPAGRVRFRIVQSPQDGQPCIVMAETLEHLRLSAGDKVIRERGGRLLGMLHPQLGVLVALGDGGFGMPPALLADIRQCMKPRASAPPSAP